MPPAVINTLVGAIPAEEGASYVAQVGEPGRITSRAGSFNLGSAALTVAAIDELHAKIFPPDQLRSLQATGLAQFDFALPGVDGMFTALAGSSPGDRWLDIRRRSTRLPPPVHPSVAAPEPPYAVAAPFAPPAAPPAAPVPAPPLARSAPAAPVAPSAPTPSSPRQADEFSDFSSLEFSPRPTRLPAAVAAGAPRAARGGDGFDDLTDLANLEFPSRDMDSGALAVTESIFEGAGETRRPDEFSWDSVAEPEPARKRFRVGLPVAAGLAIALLAAGYFGVTQYLASPADASPSAPAPRTPPPATASAPPPSPAPQQAAAAAPQQPAATAASQTATTTPPAQTATTTPPPQTASAAPRQQTPPAAPPQQTPAAAQPKTPAVSSQTPAAVPPATAKATPPSTPAAPAASGTQPRSGFSIQVAAVKTREEADQIVTRYVSQGYPAYHVRGEGAAASYYRVRIGGFADRKEAEALAKKIEGAEGIKTWIAKEIPENKSAAVQPPRKDEHSGSR